MIPTLFTAIRLSGTSSRSISRSLLKKYDKEPATEELKKKIWDELQNEKFLGRVTIPFKIVLRRDPKGQFPSYIEVILDTKV